MWRRRRNNLTAESFAHDPLARRIFIRSHREHQKRKASDAFWESAWRSSRMQGNAILAVPIFLVFALAWAIVVSLYEEAVEYIVAIRARIRKRRGMKYVRRARQYRT